MSGVNESLVREFFEARGFLVCQQRKHVAPVAAADDGIDLVILNPKRSEPAPDLPYVLGASDVDGIRMAVVAVCGWHTETFSAARLALEPEVARFSEPKRVARALRAVGLAPPATRLLVVPALPQSQSARTATVNALREHGVDAVLPFRSLLGGLIQHVETNRNYVKSDLLQVLRLLKNYDLLKEPALELFPASRRRARPRG